MKKMRLNLNRMIYKENISPLTIIENSIYFAMPVEFLILFFLYFIYISITNLISMEQSIRLIHDMLFFFLLFFDLHTSWLSHFALHSHLLISHFSIHILSQMQMSSLYSHSLYFNAVRALLP